MSALDALSAALVAGDDDQAQAAVEALTALDPPGRTQAAGHLSAWLSDASASPDQRWWAGRALAALGDSPALLPLLDDPDPALRQCAALGLRTHPVPQALDALARRLHDPDPLCARLAADALVALGESAVPALIDALQQAPHPVKLHAVRALAQIKDVRSIPALFEALSLDSALLEYWASQGLDNMGVGTSFFMPDA